jgi:hypothetical protein
MAKQTQVIDYSNFRNWLNDPGLGLMCEPSRHFQGAPAFPGDSLRLIHLPVHASWLNQVEIYFSVVQRKVFSPNDFCDLSEIESRLLAFQQHYEQIATPFVEKFTKNDLNALLERIAAHHNADPALAA